MIKLDLFSFSDNANFGTRCLLGVDGSADNIKLLVTVCPVCIFSKGNNLIIA